MPQFAVVVLRGGVHLLKQNLISTTVRAAASQAAACATAALSFLVAVATVVQPLDLSCCLTLPPCVFAWCRSWWSVLCALSLLMPPTGTSGHVHAGKGCLCTAMTGHWTCHKCTGRVLR
jgi:hypothetical protein